MDRKWADALHHLEAAIGLLHGERMRGYVDTPTGADALEQVAEDVRWEIFERSGPAAKDGSSRRIIDGVPMTGDQFWERQGWT